MYTRYQIGWYTSITSKQSKDDAATQVAEAAAFGTQLFVTDDMIDNWSDELNADDCEYSFAINTTATEGDHH